LVNNLYLSLKSKTMKKLTLLVAALMLIGGSTFAQEKACCKKKGEKCTKEEKACCKKKGGSKECDKDGKKEGDKATK
jgi:hypothetical protein